MYRSSVYQLRHGGHGRGVAAPLVKLLDQARSVAEAREPQDGDEDRQGRNDPSQNLCHFLSPLSVVPEHPYPYQEQPEHDDRQDSPVETHLTPGISISPGFGTFEPGSIRKSASQLNWSQSTAMMMVTMIVPQNIFL